MSVDDRPEIDLRVPAESLYLSVVRTAAAGLAARLDFTLDDIEDLRIAVDEACSILLTRAGDGSDLRCRFHLTSDDLTVVVQVRPAALTVPSREGFAWTLLSALAASVDIAVIEEDQLAITLVQRRPGSSTA